MYPPNVKVFSFAERERVAALGTVCPDRVRADTTASLFPGMVESVNHNFVTYVKAKSDDACRESSGRRKEDL